MSFSARESSLVQTFCESCVRLDITHQSVHMARRFVIQGCPTLNSRCKTIMGNRPSLEYHYTNAIAYLQKTCCNHEYMLLGMFTSYFPVDICFVGSSEVHTFLMNGITKYHSYCDA